MPSDYLFTNAMHWDTLVSGRGFVLVSPLKSWIKYSSGAAQPIQASQSEPIEQVHGREPVSHVQGQTLASRPADSWLERIHVDIHKIPGVESVYFAKDGENIDIWTLIPNRDLGLVRRIVEAQNEIVRLFATSGNPMFFFDFHVVYQEGRQASELVPLRSIALPRP